MVSSFDLVVRAGTVVTANGSTVSDVAVSGGRVTAVHAGIPAEAARRSVDATGMLVLPGAVDVHTHTRIASDDEPHRFFQDSVAAAHGGTTTFLAFNNPGTGISEVAQRTLRAGIEEWLLRTADDAAVDVGLSAVITAQQEDPESEMGWAVGQGIPTFKAFMVYDFGVDEARLSRLLATSTQVGAMLEVHCEDPALLNEGIARELESGRQQPRHHADSRPTVVEAVGTRRAIDLARDAGAAMYAVHLSCAAALDEIRRARAEGLPVHAETCPHFLALDSSRYQLPDAECIGYVVSPPLRDRSDVDALWVGLADGSLSVVATDHVPDRLGIEKRFAGQPFTEISNGAPGIETLLAIVYSEGVAKGRISVERMVDLLSTTPARLFGLPTKGAIEVGRDADIVLFDPKATRTLRAADLHHTSDYTPYEGMALTGSVRDVLVRGEEVIRDGRFVGRRGYGRFVERRLS